VPAYDDSTNLDEREPVWLLIEWRDGEAEPANYFFSSLNSKMTKKQLVRLIKERYRTERVYEDLKGELDSSSVLFKRYSTQLSQQEPCCPLCHRDFDSKKESMKLVDEVRLI